MTFGTRREQKYRDIPCTLDLERFVSCQLNGEDSSIIENDRQCSNDDLIGLQSIYVATEDDVLNVLQMWHDSPDTLRQPRETEIPV